VSEAREERARARYARAIERRFSDRLERPIVMSPRDWTRISDWHERGIPLPLVLESIDAAFDARRRPGSARPRSLSYVATLVDESWRVVVDGRRATPEPERPSGLPHERMAPWRKFRDRTPPGSTLRALLDRLLRAAENGATSRTLDEQLDAELPLVVPTDVAQEGERAAERDVARMRGRVPVQEIERARARAVASWLRRRLGLPRLVS